MLASSLKTAHILNPIVFFAHVPPRVLPTCPLSRVCPEHFLPHRLSKGLCVRRGGGEKRTGLSVGHRKACCEFHREAGAEGNAGGKTAGDQDSQNSY